MKTKNKHHSGGEVTELATETAKVEQYWIVGNRSEPRKPSKNYDYVKELISLQNRTDQVARVCQAQPS
jgi:hypothetical protein